MGVLYEARIRLRIVSELYTREMGPRRFFEEVDGTSYASVRRHFIKLVDYGWLRWVERSNRHQGHPEDIYRSTELAVIDDETWELIPPSIRDSFSVQNLLEMGELLADSLHENTFDATGVGLASYRSWTMDAVAWKEAIETLNDCFRSLAQEQTDARIRLERSGAAPLRMIVELGGFELPKSAGRKLEASLPARPEGLDIPPWPNRIGRLFRDPLNLEILNRIHDSAMSPSQLHRVVGGLSVEGFDRRCKRLVSLGWAVKEKELTGGSRRGATENFYRATSPAATPRQLFRGVPPTVSRTATWSAFEECCNDALVSIRTGTFNRRADRHLTLCKLRLDHVGTRQIDALLQRTHRRLARIGDDASQRRYVVGATNRR